MTFKLTNYIFISNISSNGSKTWIVKILNLNKKTNILICNYENWGLAWWYYLIYYDEKFKCIHVKKIVTTNFCYKYLHL